MEKEILSLFKEICPDFAPYHFLPTDMYKGKLIGGYNVYYKKGIDGTEGMVTGKSNIKRFDLKRFPYNFKTSSKFDQSIIEYGWTGNELVKVLEHIKNTIEKSS